MSSRSAKDMLFGDRLPMGYLPEVGPFAKALTAFWLVGALLGGKAFCYINVGGIFITEITLGVLILSARKTLKSADILFFICVLFFLIGGTIAHGNFFFSGKDLAWMYYLMFLRFFPRNFSPETLKFFTTVALLATLRPILSELGVIHDTLGEKYAIAPIVLYLYLKATYQAGEKVPFTWLFYTLTVALFADFKTLILLLLIIPVLMSWSDRLLKFLSPRYMMVAASAALVFIMFDGSQTVMDGALAILNTFSDIALGNPDKWSSGTAQWRAKIWFKALNTLSGREWVLGELPGHNFMNAKILKDQMLAGLKGSNALGVVRSAHNILVQIIMKTGIAGLAIYIIYLWRWLPKHKLIALYTVAILICSMTSDLLEVPSRGPVFFCLAWILAIQMNHKSSLNHTR